MTEPKLDACPWGHSNLGRTPAGEVFCAYGTCPIYLQKFTVEQWNSRPRLAAENEELTSQYNTLDVDYNELLDENAALEKALRGLGVLRNNIRCFCDDGPSERNIHEDCCAAARAALGE